MRLFGAFRRAASGTGGIQKLGLRAATAGCAAATAAAAFSYANVVAEAEAVPGRLVMSGDCGGTNTRLILFRVAPGATATQGENPKGTVLYEQKYLNADNASFTAVCQKFLAEARPFSAGETPQVCCLACAGGITDNCVSFTNVKDGWTIDGNQLGLALGIGKVKLINDFEAQGYGLLTLQPHECIRLNDAKPRPGAPIACVGAGTGLGECFLTAADGAYTCWPSEGGHAEFSPRSEITHELLNHMREKLTEFGTPEKIERVFRRWDADGSGAITRDEFSQAVSDLDLKGLRPKRISVERIVSGPGISDVCKLNTLHLLHTSSRLPRTFSRLPHTFSRLPHTFSRLPHPTTPSALVQTTHSHRHQLATVPPAQPRRTSSWWPRSRV